MTNALAPNVDDFITRWESAGGSERANARVAMRVRQGGHDVPTETIRRRFAAGLRHFESVYRYRVDYWQLFDNSGAEPMLKNEGGNT